MIGRNPEIVKALGELADFSRRHAHLLGLAPVHQAILQVIAASAGATAAVTGNEIVAVRPLPLSQRVGVPVAIVYAQGHDRMLSQQIPSNVDTSTLGIVAP